MKTQNTLLITLFILFFGLIHVYGQNGITQTIRGTVTDAASGAPIPYATVTLPEQPGIGTTTNSDGEFAILQVPIGRYTVQCSFVGYEPATLREILVSSAKEVNLDITLKESATQLDEVVVRPKVNKEEPLNPMATTGARMLSVEEASRYAGGMDDPARLVSSFAGVSPGISHNGISVHGNAPYMLQWRLEDVEIPNPNHFADVSNVGGGILSSLSSHVLGNSDFFTGAFPAEYGNALSGVFDMKMRNGNNRKMENTFQFGILGIDIASEGPFSKNSNSSYIFNYRYSTLGLMDQLSPGDEMGESIGYQDLNFKLNFPTRKAGTFTIWSTSSIDKMTDDTSDDPADWEYAQDNFDYGAKQYMAAGGVSHRYRFRNDAYLKTTLAATYSQYDVWMNSLDNDLVSSPWLDLQNRNTNLILTSTYNRKFSARHTNRTGFTYTRMIYDMRFDKTDIEGDPMERLSQGDGQTDLVNVYSQSAFELGKRLTLNVGVNGQFLTLNNSWTVEPRIGLRWQAGQKTTLALAYGLYSRMEKMDVFFVRSAATGNELVNKNLDFTKSHHFMFTYAYKISDYMNLRIEPYYQQLFDVPVEPGTSWSLINRTDFYVDNALVSKGKGYNYGIDITLERYLNKGLYYMATVSLFDSQYKGGDGVWRDTRYNRNYVVNGLIGKEWMLGPGGRNVFSVSTKLSYQGGERYSPVDEAATLAHPDKEVQYDETRAFTKQYPADFIASLNISYRMNRPKVSHEFGFSGLNITRATEYYGHHYNLQTHKIERNQSDGTMIMNISYKLNF